MDPLATLVRACLYPGLCWLALWVSLDDPSIFLKMLALLTWMAARREMRPAPGAEELAEP